MVPPLQAMLPSEAKLMSITSLVSMSLKLTVPLSLRSCAEASAASVIAAVAVALTVGASLVPVMVKLTVSLSLRTVVVGRGDRVAEGDGLAGIQEIQVRIG